MDEPNLLTALLIQNDDGEAFYCGSLENRRDCLEGMKHVIEGLLCEILPEAHFAHREESIGKPIVLTFFTKKMTKTEIDELGDF